MLKKTLIFGNGLGMALNPHHFSLQRAMADVWNGPGFISGAHKALIGLCLGGYGLVPQREDQLDPLHRVVAACQTLCQINASQQLKVHWLSAEGQEFPVAVANYIHKVATNLHLYNGSLPPEFLLPLVQFLRDTKSHVATLNYDKLLYGAFIDEGLMQGYYGTTLVDGMTQGGFSSENLERRYGNDFGYYLHLHGSPLFYDDDDGFARKRDRRKLNMHSPEGSDHIVLTHVRHKRTVIGASAVLSAYWRYLQVALSESHKIIVFGYSGDDEHLNDMIAAYAQTRVVLVVEWSGLDETQDQRIEFWKHKFNVPVIQHLYLPSVLAFTNWWA